jgi:hypothetical protein
LPSELPASNILAMKNEISREEALRVLDTFDSLPIERRVHIFRDLSAEAREELLEVVGQPQQITRRISEEELYVTVKELGEENARGFLAQTTGRQLRYILDLELWKRDMFDPSAAGHWLEILAGLGEDKLLHFLQVTDPEVILLGLSPFVRVSVRNPELDLLEEMDYLPSFTLDDLFFVEFRSARLDVALRDLFSALFDWDHDYYFSLMQNLAVGVNVELESEGLRKRRARLSEKGFPEFDEALQIYQYLRPDAVTMLPEGPSDDQWESEPETMLTYPLRLIEAETLFRECLERLPDDREQERVSRELGHLANKVMVADARDPGSLDDLRGSLRKVSGYINIALEHACGTDVLAAGTMLRSNHMEILFRRGFSLILDLRKEVQRLLRETEGGPENLGYPLAEMVAGLLRKRPVYLGDLAGGGKAREFERLDDLGQIRESMDRQNIEDRWEPV